jgi:NAD(P)-dependent dehydrogenase (short-subunit alcohol dehydrogenase family)
MTGKHVVVTGAGTGIGRAIALRVSREGASVTLVARGQEWLEATAAAIDGPTRVERSRARFPSSMREAITALEQGWMARAAFGDQVVDHHLNYVRTEQGLFDRFVTDWERKRYFERI